jgi:zinc transport system permease protein
MADAGAPAEELPEGLSPDDLTLDGEHAHDEPAHPGAVHTPEAHADHTEHTEAGTLRPSVDDFMLGWNQGIYQDPVYCGILAGLALGVLGVFVVLRRAVFVTAAVSQAAALGVALAFFFEIHLALHVPPVMMALILALASTGVLALPVERLRLTREAALGLAFVIASAAAILVGDRIAQEAHDISAILFGTAVLVRPEDLVLVAVVGVLVVGAVIVNYRGLEFAGFDPEGARVHGLPVRTLDLLLWALVALEVSVTTRALGALPVFAFAVVPAMAALSLVDRLPTALLLSALIGALAGGLGYLFAFFLAFPVGASQATVSIMILLLCWPLALLRRRR